jgi:hypothetical protein
MRGAGGSGIGNPPGSPPPGGPLYGFPPGSPPIGGCTHPNGIWLGSHLASLPAVLGGSG